MKDFQEKIKLALQNSNLDDFNFKEFELAGDICVLVNPKSPSVKWNKYNIYLRSVIYRKDDYFPISLGFFKFPNWGEREEVFPLPESLIGGEAKLKLDGSCLILSRYKNINIIRSRGSNTIEHFENKSELEIFKQKYPLLFSFSENIEPTVDYSILCEWVSPKQKIVLKYENPELILIGGISHNDYSLFTQEYLDFIGKKYNLPRPESFKFNSINDMLEMVKKWGGLEGICLYSNYGQSIHKIKAEKYLIFHSCKSQFNSIENLIDLFISQNCPKYEDFFLNISNMADYEIASNFKNEIQNICAAYKEVLNIINEFKDFISNNQLLTRKVIAIKIIQSYGQTGRSGIIFTLLDKKDLDKNQIKKLLFQVLKKD